MELVAKEHEVLVDAIVVDLVPVQVEDVEEVLKPGPLVCDRALLVGRCNEGEKLGNPRRDLVLVDRLVRVPEGYSVRREWLTEEESFPDYPHILHFHVFVVVRSLHPSCLGD